MLLFMTNTEFFNEKQKETFMKIVKSIIEMDLQENYNPEKLLGIGSEGIVISCHIKNNSQFNNIVGLDKIAMKIIFDNNTQTLQSNTNLNQEFKFHNLLAHLNIVQYYTMYSRIPFPSIPNSFMKFFPESNETKYFKNPKNGIFFIIGNK